MTYKAFSFGGGVQSMACLVLAAQGRIDYKTFLFSNVGDDSEHPATLAYLEAIAKPFAEAHGLTLIVLERRNRAGEVQTLWNRLMREGSRSLPIPVRMNGNGAPGRRSCTATFKIEVLSKYFKQQGCTKDNPGVAGIGISLDEYRRARNNSGIAWQTLDYPLIDLRITREGCKAIIAEAGLPVPPKSSCFFCPFHDLKAWQKLYDETPELFAKAVLLEQTLNDRRQMLGKDPVWLTRFLKPLDQVITGSHQRQMPMFDVEPEWQHSCGPFVCTNTDTQVT